MFRKIHSNRDPGTSITREIRKEFGPYFQQFDSWFGKVASNYPKQLFVSMVIALLFSAALSFTVFRNRELPAHQLEAGLIGRMRDKRTPVTDQFGQLMATASKLQETIELKHQIEEIVAKPHLSATDSFDLNKALDRLRVIQKPINP